MALDFQGRHDQALEEQKDEAELLADATDSGCYDGGEFRKRSEVVGDEQRQERRRGTTTVRLFIAGMSSPGCDSARRRCHGDGDVPARGKAAQNARRRQLRGAGGGALLSTEILKYLQNCH